jgi:ABC-type nitrate/sulfonate/bicarbonate transport system substrate-binding protein
MNKVIGLGFISKKSLLSGLLALSAATFCIPTNGNAEDIKLAASAIGRPPIFSNTFVDVGEAKGYWKKAGLDVTFRWFQRGTDTAKAVVTGDVQVGYTATPPAVNLIASGAPIVVIAGMPNQDWLLASDDPNVKGCKDLKGQTVAADGINNARTLFLQSYLQSCGLQLSDVKMIDLANQPLVKAGIAGQVHNGIWHIDELAQVQHKVGNKWRQLQLPKDIYAGLHYAVLIASKKAIEENREGIIRFLVGWIQTQKLMSSTKPEDQDAFAKIAAAASQIDLAVAKASIVDFQKLPYWVNNDGLPEKQLMAQVDDLVRVGIMKAENKPAYSKIVDKSLYAEAAKRVAAMQ